MPPAHYEADRFRIPVAVKSGGMRIAIGLGGPAEAADLKKR